MAELEPYESKQRHAYVSRATSLLADTDRMSVDEIHLAAILQALRNGPIRGLRPSEPGRRRSSMSLTAEVETALDQLDRANRRRPYSGSIQRDRAALLISLDRLPEASVELSRARKSVMSDPRIDLLEGVIAYRRSKFDEAIRLFRQALDQDEHDHVHHRALAVAYFANGQQRLAVETLMDAIKTIEDSRWPNADAARAQLEATAIQLTALRLRQMRPLSRAWDVRRLLTPEMKAIVASRPRGGSVTSSREADTTLALAAIDAATGRPDSAATRRKRVREWDPDHPGLAGSRHSTPESSFDLGAWRRPLLLLFLISTVVIFVGTLAASFATVLPDGVDTIAAGIEANATKLFLLGPTVFGVAFLITLFDQRLTGLKVGSVLEATLEAGELVPEIVHVDLDMSVSRLLVVSGFSHFRPEVRNFFHDDRSLFGQ